MFMSCRTRHALTLIELVIVCAIVLALASLLVPAIQMVMHSARRMACSAHLRQLGMMALAYAGEHDDRLPAAEKLKPETAATSPAWFCRLPGYVEARDIAHGGRAFQCAAWRDSARLVFTAASPKSLKWNAYLDDAGRARHHRLGTWNNESAVCLMADGIAGEFGMGQWGHLVDTGIDEVRHRGVVNVLCLDGHAQQATRRSAITWIGD